MMFPAPDLVHYACIARGTTVLAEFNSKDEKLGSIAEKCLLKTPPYHSIFSHTVRSQTYTFLIDESFVYFAIFDENMKKSEGLGFLRSVKEASDKFFKGDLAKKRLDRVSSHCFQGEFNPVFHRLLGPVSEPEVPADERLDRLDQSGNLYSGSSHLGSPNGDSSVTLKKKKHRLFGDFKITSGGLKVKGGSEKRVDIDGEEDDDDDKGGILLSREFSVVMQKNGMYSGELMGSHNNHKAKKVWKKQVWIVLSLDLFVCTILFIVWLCVCRGFKCIDS